MSERDKMRLFHGGHKGTEAEFCRAGERWNVAQTTLSFEGHRMERSRNVEVLDDETLNKGRVSMDFVFQAMGRRFTSGHGIRRVIHSMFHLVTRTDELFAVGTIQENGSVRGGTGWGVELGKLFNRKVHVYDQDRRAWFSWDHHDEWQQGEPTLPDSGGFSATGTRNLTDAGREAIDALFKRSLG